MSRFSGFALSSVLTLAIFVSRQKMTSLFNVLLVYLFSIELALTENCQEIIDSEVKSGIESERSSGDGVPLTVTLYKWNINCQTVGTVKGTFGSLSISAFYLNNGNSMNETGRIAFDCIQESDVVFEWRADTLLFLGNTEDVGLLTGDTLTNCSSCRGVNNYECIGTVYIYSIQYNYLCSTLFVDLRNL